MVGGDLEDCMGYPCIELDVEKAKKLLERISETLGYSTSDLEDAIRIIDNFDEYYRYSTRKFKEYLVPAKSESDLIRGRVVIDRVKLKIVGSGRRVLIVFDRRINRETVKKALETI
ncbi:MAG: hypothetical protein QXQ57_05580 [Sulfolobales archaeon]